MQPVAAAQEEATRRRQAEVEGVGIRLVHLLVTCAAAIQAGNYSVAHGTMARARRLLCMIPTTSTFGRLAVHFTASSRRPRTHRRPHRHPPC